MPLLGFKSQFAPLVESGTKRQTIRAKRRDGKDPRVGETLYLYTGLRTKQCRKLGEEICKSVEEIIIDYNGINVSGKWLSISERDALAQADGFPSFQDMKKFFQKKPGLEDEFSGRLLIKW
jgi:hypothetical protein